MRGDNLYKILNFLEDRCLDQVNFWQAVFKSGYGASIGKLDYEHRKIVQQNKTKERERIERRRFQKYLSNLKQDGLILENSKGELALSLSGRLKLKKLQKERLLAPAHYKETKNDRVTIISYDLPLRFNKERNKLREILRILGFRLVHQSVWVGKVKVPANFISTLKKMNLLRYVEILEVTKSGSLKDIDGIK